MFFAYSDVNREAFVSNTYLTAVGKLPTFTVGDKKYSKIIAIANLKIDEWAREADWRNLYDPKYQVGTISATDTYELDDDVEKVTATYGDYILVRKDGRDTKHLTVAPDKLKMYDTGNYCAFIGRSLVFNRTFTTDDEVFGGTILAPVKLYPEKLTSASSTVPVSDPNWLVKITAAEWVRNDNVRQNQYPNLVAEANALMEKMKEANDEAQNSEVTIAMPPVGRSW